MADAETPRPAATLAAADLRLQYGDIAAVWSATLRVEAGTATAVVGRNGAGKTTLANGLAGLLRPVSGTISIDDTDVTRASPWRRAALGLALVPEGKRVFRDLRVIENLSVAAPREARERVVAELLDRFPALAERRRALAGTLSGGQQQLLAIATALASRPRVLILDEPTSGLSPLAIEAVTEALVALKREGMTILIIEQMVDAVVSQLADQVLTLESGRLEDRPSIDRSGPSGLPSMNGTRSGR